MQFAFVRDELTHLCTFPDSAENTPEVYQCLFRPQLCTTRSTKRKRSTDIEPIELEQIMSQIKQTTPSKKESTNGSDHEKHKNSGMLKKAKYQ